jgi:hypothetical protein
MSSESSLYSNRWLPILLVSPLMLLIALFFYAPVFQAFYWSFFLEQPFGGGSEFVGVQNFARVLSDPEFWNASARTVAAFMLTASSLAVVRSSDAGHRGRPENPFVIARAQCAGLAEGGCRRVDRCRLRLHIQSFRRASGAAQCRCFRASGRRASMARTPSSRWWHGACLGRHPVQFRHPAGRPTFHSTDHVPGSRHGRRRPMAAHSSTCNCR